MPASLFDHFQNNASSPNGSGRIFLEGGKGQDKTPKKLTLWSRFVHACKELFKSKATLKANNKAVRKNFQKALNQKYSSAGVLSAHFDTGTFLNNSQNLRAGDVREMIDFVAAKAEKSVHVGHYHFNTTYAPRTGSVPIRLIKNKRILGSHQTCP